MVPRRTKARGKLSPGPCFSTPPSWHKREQRRDKGQSAATHLQKALGVKLKDIEAEWSAYVKDIAG